MSAIRGTAGVGAAAGATPRTNEGASTSANKQAGQGAASTNEGKQVGVQTKVGRRGEHERGRTSVSEGEREREWQQAPEC